jgi:hypothetical protein
MSGIVPALIPDDILDILRQDIDYLAFSFVAPLGADQYGCLSHVFPFTFKVSL